MTERPIPFSGPLVRAILAGRKTETRRPVTSRTSHGPQLVWEHDADGEYARSVPGWANLDLGARGPTEPHRCDHERRYCCAFVDGRGSTCEYLHVPARDHQTRHRVYSRIEPGDTLWVRETIWQSRGDGYMAEWGEWEPGDWTRTKVCYDADGEPAERRIAGRRQFLAKRPSIHMPRWAARLFLRVTEVRAERVKEIDDAGALREGIEGQIGGEQCPCCEGSGDFEDDPDPGCRNCESTGVVLTPREQFAQLWDSIYSTKRGLAWGENPWCWVVKFEVSRVTLEQEAG